MSIPISISAIFTNAILKLLLLYIPAVNSFLSEIKLIDFIVSFCSEIDIMLAIYLGVENETFGTKAFRFIVK